MNKGTKRTFIVLAIVLLVVLAASIVLRMMLTRDRLIAMIVPRIEQRADARIGIGDMSVRFPFGFGVKASDLTFEKDLPEGGSLVVRSREAAVDVSLLSLMRKRPDIKRISIDGADVDMPGTGGRPGLKLGEIKGQFSMQPGDSAYSIGVDMKIAAVRIEKGSGGGFEISDLSISSVIGSSFDFSDLDLPETDIVIGGFLKAAISATLSDAQGEGRFEAAVESGEAEIGRLVEYLIATGIVSSPPGEEGSEPGGLIPVDVSSGTVSVKAGMKGSLRQVSGAAIDGKIVLSGLEAVHQDSGLPFRADGEILFDGSSLKSEDFTVSSGGSSVKSSFEVALDAGRRPVRVDFKAEIDAMAEDMPGLSGNDSLDVSGKITGRIEAGGKPGDFAALVPGQAGDRDPAAARRAWDGIGLSGEIALSGGRFRMEGQPLEVSDLDLGCSLGSGGFESITAEMKLDGRPWSLEGSARGIFPCASEMMILAGERADDRPGGAGKGGPSLGEILDKVTVLPVVSLRVRGRAFDARPFSNADRGQASGQSSGSGSAGSPESDARGGSPDARAMAGSAGIFLLNTKFTAQIDSVMTEKAIFTSVRSDGAAIRGVVRAREIALDYAGGRGQGTAEIDLRDHPKIRSSFNIRFSDVQADRALVRIHSLGALLKGTFSFGTSGLAYTGPGIDPLSNLSASGDATSNNGILDLSGLLTPVSSAFNIDLSRLEKVDFRSWTGKYSIKDGRLATEDWQIRSKAGDWAIAGSFGFDGSLAYRARLVIPPAVQAEMQDLRKYGDIVDLFKDETGNIVLDLDIGGSASDPKVRLDQTAAKAKAGQKLLDNLKGEGVDKLKSLFKKKNDR